MFGVFAENAYFCNVNNINHFITPVILGYGLYWVNEGKKEDNLKSKRR